jgi:FkbM family methyltransferase
LLSAREASLKFVTREDLMNCPPAQHFVKSWSGIVDPKDSTLQTSNPVWEQLSQKEPHEPHFHLFSALTGGRLFLDIGANCGQSIVSLKSVLPDARIVSFEPTTFSFSIAERVSRVFSDVRVNNFGLSDEPGRLPIYTPVVDGLLITPLSSLDPGMFEPDGTMHTLLTKDIAQGAPVTIFSEEIELRRGDDLKLKPDVMKIDVEGAEMRVLAGLARTINLMKPLIMTEKSDAVAIAAFLGEFGYVPMHYESKRPEDRHMLARLPIGPATNPAHIPLNIFYAHPEQAERYKSDFGLVLNL